MAWHFAKECPKKRGDLVRAALLEGLALPENSDVVSVDFDEPNSDEICSVSEGEIQDNKVFSSLASVL